MREMLFAMAAVVSDNDKKTRHGQIELAGWVPREKKLGEAGEATEEGHSMGHKRPRHDRGEFWYQGLARTRARAH